MTKEDLINAGYKPQACKIGTLYFKDGFFCRLHADKCIFYSTSDDMTPLGTVDTIEEITELEKKYYRDEIAALETKLELKKLLFEKRFGETL